MKRADEEMGFLLRYENVAWYEDGAVRILDRRVYPMETRYVICRRHEEVAQAIADMVTQSAGPYTAAAMGMALAAYEGKDKGRQEAETVLEKAACTLSHARPTTAARMEEITARSLSIARECLSKGEGGQELVEALFRYAFQRIDDNYRKYESVGENLAKQIPPGGTILTQCFGETIIGTLLNACRRRKNDIHVICAETRPYFQGARLTASVVCDMGFDVTVITDNMAGCTMKTKQVDVFTSAADVITMDGHVINKVGTFQLALLADYYKLPYYVTGSPNPAHPDTASVVIEERDPELALRALDVKVTKEGVKGYYPAFDITPPELVSGVVTSRGIYGPYDLKRFYE